VSERAFLALGSNLGDKQAQLDDAVRRLRAVVEVVRVSRALITPPLLPPGDATPQPDYLNAVVEVRSPLQPRALLDAVKRIEKEMGRADATRWAPRLIDIDVLAVGSQVLDEGGFVLPHPGLPHRRFVLEPLVELAPDWVHPVLQRTARQLLDALPVDARGAKSA
jgi:2-amino-4-hydroxy-6-hydroxymethyldihydropteridine diphosphokinase